MTEWPPPDWSRSRAVLVGTSAYDKLTDVPAAAHSLNRMHRLLISSLCGWPVSQVSVFPELHLPGDLPDRLIDLYKKADSFALFYYVGHGQIDGEGQLCLGLAGSRPEAERRAATSLTFDAVRRALSASRASMKVIILDCCFAGLAVREHRTLARHVADLASVTGAYTLAAAGPYSTALFESDQDSPTPYTHFTKHFAEIVERGLPGASADLTLDLIYQRLRDDPDRAGKPQPTCISLDAAGTFPFARNAAARIDPDIQPEANGTDETAGRDPYPVQADRVRVTRILGEALRAAQSIAGKDQKARALAIIAGAVAATDRERAARLIADAERIARSITKENAKAWGLANIAAAVAVTDPERAEGIARSITKENVKAQTLASIAQVVAASDPERAERIAQLISRWSGAWGWWASKDKALAGIAEAMAVADPERAEQIAQWITGEGAKAQTLASVAAAVAASDPERAARLIDDVKRTGQLISIWGRVWEWGSQDTALARIAEAMAVADPERAEQIAQSFHMGSKDLKARLLASIAAAVAASDPERAARLIADAERTAQSITELTRPGDPEHVRPRALASVAMASAVAAAATDREYAARLIDDAERIARSMSIAHSAENKDTREQTLAIIAAAAATDPERAEGIARSITRENVKAQTLASIAEAVAASDPEGAARLIADAERTAQSITDNKDVKAQTLASIAQVAAATDPERAARLIDDAERTAQSISRWSSAWGMPSKGSTLARITEVVATTDPERAERIAQSITPEFAKVLALVRIAKTLNKG